MKCYELKNDDTLDKLIDSVFQGYPREFARKYLKQFYNNYD